MLLCLTKLCRKTQPKATQDNVKLALFIASKTYMKQVHEKTYCSTPIHRTIMSQQPNARSRREARQLRIIGSWPGGNIQSHCCYSCLGLRVVVGHKLQLQMPHVLWSLARHPKPTNFLDEVVIAWTNNNIQLQHQTGFHKRKEQATKPPRARAPRSRPP